MKRSNITSIFTVTLYFLASFAAFAVPEYTAPYSKTVPVMDGKVLDDPAWKEIPWSGEFVVQSSSKKKKKTNESIRKAEPGKTAFKALYTADSLYLALRCEEPRMDKVLEESGVTEFWKYDVVEFFSFVRKDELLHLLLSIHNRVMDEIPNAVNERTGGYNTWEARSFRGKKAWFAEIRVPLFLLGTAPKDGKNPVSFPFNLCRFDTPTQNFTTWADVTTYRSAEQYGTLRLAPPPESALPLLKKALELPPDIALIRRWNMFKSDPYWDAASKAEKTVCDELEAILKKDPSLAENAEKFGEKMKYLDSRRAAIEKKHKEDLKKRFFED